MFAYIEGEVTYIEEDRVVVDVGQIGYEILVSQRDLVAISGVGSHHRFFTYFQVSENGIGLYGFLHYEDKKFFEKLIGVSGVGPKAALAILGTMSVNDLKFAILGDDEKAISKAPGVGPKIAKRIILDLKDKVDLAEAYESRVSPQGSDHITAVKNDVLMAMTALGYSSSDALKAMSMVEITEDMQEDQLLKATLRMMNV